MKRRVSDNNFDIVLLISRYVIYCWLKIKHMSKIQYKISLLPTTIKMFFFFFFLGGGGGVRNERVFSRHFVLQSLLMYVNGTFIYCRIRQKSYLPYLNRQFIM